MSDVTITQLDTYIRKIPNCTIMQLWSLPCEDVTITQLDAYIREIPNCTIVQLWGLPYE